MRRHADLALAAAAPAVWGSTYLITTEALPEGYPLTAAMLRALPAGLILLALTRHLPRGLWIARVVLLGVLNFALFWWLLFVAAYSLPGGMAATVGAVQPLIVLGLSSLLLGQPVRRGAVLAGIGGLIGVGLLVLSPAAATLDPLGLAAALGGALSMAAGTVLTRKWQPPVPALTFTAWQLTAGGLLLLPVALLLEPPLPALSAANIAGFAWLTLIGGAVSYLFWFRGIARLGPNAVAPLGFLSPVTAVLLGMVVLGQIPGPVQAAGMVLVLLCVWLGGRANRPVSLPPSAGLPQGAR
ncbi:DMT family transporter [Salipiger sp. P9]|uniref:DMT family transporter n=1 Tax=Salipiger pentaromativorans TaxID=2943193 RepID=UPI0021574D23|nr:DMT family transporter [Salipiger pentaromativorans]MCR8546863.1 DMT family transporter [Salipiger pentaromativorans]